MVDHVVVRELSADDLPALSWAGAPRHLSHIDDAIRRSMSGETVFLGALLGDEIVGMCGIDFAPKPDGGKLWMLNVRPTERSAGIGSLLMTRAEQRIREQGRNRAYLSVEAANTRASALYQRLGYVIDGETSESWEDTAPDGSLFTYHATCFAMHKNLGLQSDRDQ